MRIDRPPFWFWPTIVAIMAAGIVMHVAFIRWVA